MRPGGEVNHGIDALHGVTYRRGISEVLGKARNNPFGERYRPARQTVNSQSRSNECGADFRAYKS
jgi:hypothetical protein